jgi:hypothetical protein
VPNGYSSLIKPARATDLAALDSFKVEKIRQVVMFFGKIAESWFAVSPPKKNSQRTSTNEANGPVKADKKFLHSYN